MTRSRPGGPASNSRIGARARMSGTTRSTSARSGTGAGSGGTSRTSTFAGSSPMWTRSGTSGRQTTSVSGPTAAGWPVISTGRYPGFGPDRDLPDPAMAHNPRRLADRRAGPPSTRGSRHLRAVHLCTELARRGPRWQGWLARRPGRRRRRRAAASRASRLDRHRAIRRGFAGRRRGDARGPLRPAAVDVAPGGGLAIRVDRRRARAAGCRAGRLPMDRPERRAR